MFRSTLSRLTSNSPALFYALKKADLALHHALGRPFESDFLRFKEAGKRLPELTIVDVGANIGQSAIGFASLFPSGKIVSFEANPDLEGYLQFCQSLIGQRFSFQMVGLSEVTADVTLFIPKRGAVLIYGEAAIDRNALNDTAVEKRIGAFGVAQQQIRLVNFDQLAIEPDIVKIDVQGHELSVLRGMTKTIGKVAPAFLIERSASDAAIMELFKPFGYSFHIAIGAGPLMRYDSSIPSLNMFALPAGTAGRRQLVEAILQ